MKELLDKVNEKYMEQQETIASQQRLVEGLKVEILNLKQDINIKEGQIMELNSKWNKMQKLLQGIKQ